MAGQGLCCWRQGNGECSNILLEMDDDYRAIYDHGSVLSCSSAQAEVENGCAKKWCPISQSAEKDDLVHAGQIHGPIFQVMNAQVKELELHTVGIRKKPLTFTVVEDPMPPAKDCTENNPYVGLMSYKNSS